jgi:hypothetical protein
MADPEDFLICNTYCMQILPQIFCMSNIYAPTQSSFPVLHRSNAEIRITQINRL